MRALDAGRWRRRVPSCSSRSRRRGGARDRRSPPTRPRRSDRTRPRRPSARTVTPTRTRARSSTPPRGRGTTAPGRHPTSAASARHRSAQRVSSGSDGPSSTPPTSPAYIRASDRALVMPLAAGISASWKSRSLAVAPRSSPNAPFSATRARSTPPRRACRPGSRRRCPSGSSARRGSYSSGRPIQNSSP